MAWIDNKVDKPDIHYCYCGTGDDVTSSSIVKMYASAEVEESA